MSDWKPVEGHVMTEWAGAVDPAAPLPEHPRPQMVRSDWQNLNGLWDYAVTAREAPEPAAFDGAILVPFAIETALSGVRRPLLPNQRLWYRRSFTVPESWSGQRILLHFEAVDWQCVCSVNGVKVGEHTGGYVPFCFDISNALQAGANLLLVAVCDPTDQHWQQRGKQVLEPKTIYYTATSGIWQTVWLEPVPPDNHIERIAVLPDIDAEVLEVQVFAASDCSVRLIASSGDEEVSPIFLHGPLDQGYWPDAGMTPPSDAALLFDVEKTLQLGFNMTRKHVKVEPRRWYYHTDRLGLTVIQDMVSGGGDMRTDTEVAMVVALDRHRKDTTKRALRKTRRDSAESRSDFERELYEVIDHLHGAASILVWVPFNEAWGHYDAARIAELVKRRDPSRLVDHASGWEDQGAGDFKSRHTYRIKLRRPPRKDPRIYFISESGGCNFQEAGHLWDEKGKFGYGTLRNKKALAEAYTRLIRAQLIPLISRGLGAAVYTQWSDVEIESNGFFTYDRKILKIDRELVSALNDEIYRTFEDLERGNRTGSW